MTKAVSVCVIAAALLTAAGCRSSKEGDVAKGNKLFAAGKYPEALLNYRKAIQKDPRYGEAHYRIGLVALRTDDPATARQALQEAVQLAPNNVDAKEKLGGLLLQYYWADPQRSQTFYTQIKQISDQLLSKDPNSFEGLREKAFLAYSDRKLPDAIALFRKALQAKPSDGSVNGALVKALFENGQGQEAESVALSFIAINKSEGATYDALFQWYLASNRFADAENILKTKVANNPANAKYILELAAYYSARQNPTQMKATLQLILNDQKNFASGRLWVGDFYLAMKAYPEAIQYYQEALRSAKGDQKIQFQKKTVNALVAAGKRDEAARLVEQILKEDPNNAEARRIQAYLLLRTGGTENVAEAEREFQKLSKEKADDVMVWLGLGRADELKGDLSAARTQYMEALKRRPDYLPAKYALAEIGLIQNQPDQTLRQADEILRIQSRDPRAKLLRAQALARTGNRAAARADLNGIIKDSPKQVQPQLELGLLDLAEQKYGEAIEIFEKLRPTGDPRAGAGLAMSYKAQKQFDKSIAVLQDELKKSPDSRLLRGELASTAALAGQYDVAIGEYRKLLAGDTTSVRERLQLGDVYVLKGDYDGAINVYREAFNLSPKNLETGLALARALSDGGRAGEAKAQLQAVLSTHPDDPFALNEMAYFLSVNGGDLEEALKLAQRALAKSPGQPSFSDTIGCIYLKKGLRDSAVQVFTNLVLKYPKYPTFRYHLGMALLEKGDKQQAKKELDTALGSHPSRQDEARIRELLSKIS